MASWSSRASKGLGRLGWLPWAIEWYTRVLPGRVEINELLIECRGLFIVLEVRRGKNDGIRRSCILLSECLLYWIVLLIGYVEGMSYIVIWFYTFEPHWAFVQTFSFIFLTGVKVWRMNKLG